MESLSNLSSTLERSFSLLTKLERQRLGLDPAPAVEPAAQRTTWIWRAVLVLSFVYVMAAGLAVTLTEEIAPALAKPVPVVDTPLPADTPPSYVWVFPPLGGPSVVYELDLLISVMVLLTLLHAASNSTGSLALAGLGLGLVTENLSLRLGGTHCHASGLIDWDQCSSFNSVVYYVPWVYAGVTCARRLVDPTSWACPLLCGLLFFCMCGVYETQGPTMGWWLWPRADGLVKPGATMLQFGEPAADARGLVAAAHAAEALSVRVDGVPSLAPFFHFAFGWGIATAFQVQARYQLPGGDLLPVLLGPALALVWDPTVRLFEWSLGATKTAGAMCIMLTAFALPLLAGPPLSPAPKRDLLLFLVPLSNAGFFAYNALLGRGAAVEGAELQMFVLTLATVSTVAYARAAGLLTPAANPGGKPTTGSGAMV